MAGPCLVSSRYRIFLRVGAPPSSLRHCNAPFFSVSVMISSFSPITPSPIHGDSMHLMKLCTVS